MPYLLDDITGIIKDNLGLGRVDVELDPAHFQRGIDAALKALCRWFPQYGSIVVPIASGGQKVALSNVPNILGVLNVTFFTSGLRMEEAPYYTRWVDRLMELGDMKDTQRVFGDTPEWQTRMEPSPLGGNDVCWLYYTFTRSSFIDTYARIPDIACVWFAWAIEASNDPLVGVQRIPVDLRQWVEDYATARCQLIMGGIRGKFGGVPGADDGSMMPTDGAALRAEARETMRELEENLQKRVRQAPLMMD